MRKLEVCLAMAAALVIIGQLVPRTAAAGAGAAAEFLDLPGGDGTATGIEKPPDIIDIYETPLEGDAFFFCLDRSRSMSYPDARGQIKFEVLKREVARALQGLSADSVACVHFYDGSVEQLTYGNPPARMDGPGKARVIGEVAGTALASGSCLCRGAEKVLAIANACDRESRTIMIVGDGRTQCANGEGNPERVFQRIMAKNVFRLPISAVYTGPQTGEEWELGMPLLKRLALATNGQFRIAR
jgi:hypothetical protein